VSGGTSVRGATVRRGIALALVASIVMACASAHTHTPTPTGSDVRAATPSASASASSPSDSSPSRRASAPPSVTRAPSATASTTELSRDDGWRADIDALLEARDRLNPNPWHNIDRATWLAAADAAKAAIADRTDDQALVDLVRLAAMPGWGGRDGHTGIFPFAPGSGTHEYPIRLWRFSDGLVITDARAPYADIIGSRIDAVEGRPIDDVVALVEPLAPRDNPSNLTAYGPLYLRVSELLAGLGVTTSPGPATFTVRSAAGKHRDVRIEPISADLDVAWHGGAPMRLPAGTPLWLTKIGTPLWSSYLPESRTLYVQYNEVAPGIDAVAAEILGRAKAGDVDRVVIDLRHNGGGDNSTYSPLLTALQDPAIDRPGRMFVLIGRNTFSAAANFATEVEKKTGALFAGEAMGGSPNLYGDALSTDLPYGPQKVYVASRYWQFSTPEDPRLTIEPDIPIALSSADYLAGRDPVMDAVIARKGG
jgi:hypothetical protein